MRLVKENARPSLSNSVAANVRAEAARAGMTQGDVAKAMGMSRVSVSDRYRGVIPWTVDELDYLATEVFGVELAELLRACRDSNPKPSDSEFDLYVSDLDDDEALEAEEAPAPTGPRLSLILGGDSPVGQIL